MFRLWLAVCIAMTALDVSLTCTKVHQEVLHCLEWRNIIHLNCPQYHTVSVAHAEYQMTQSTQCFPAPVDRCSMTDLSYHFQRDCIWKRTCSVYVSRPLTVSRECAYYTGVRYAYIKYSCRPDSFGSIQNASFSIGVRNIWTGSYAYLASHPQAFGSGQTYLYSTNQYCNIHLPKDTEAEIKLELLHTKDNTAPMGCNQHVLIQDSWITSKLCNTQNTSVIVRCLPVERFIYLSYSSSDSSTGVVFLVSISVYHKAQFTLQCGLYGHTTPDATYVSSSTTATTSSTTSTSTSTPTSTADSPSPSTPSRPTSTMRYHDNKSSSSHQNKSARVPEAVILGTSVGGAVMIVLLATSVFIFCAWRKSRKLSMKTEGPVIEDCSYTECVNEIYLPSPRRDTPEGTYYNEIEKDATYSGAEFKY